MSPEPVWIAPGSFDPPRHFFAGALAEAPHPALRALLDVPAAQLAGYCAARSDIPAGAIGQLLAHRARYLLWAGIDVMPVATSTGERSCLLIESNSCPAGQKYLPMRGNPDPQGGYRRMIAETFAPLLAEAPPRDGGLAVLYGKNVIEASGYAAAMADHYGEPVVLAPFADEPGAGCARFVDGRLFVRIDGRDAPMRAALRYITQRPWNRLPADPDTVIVNPLAACLAGGRNKSAAAIAYDRYNRSAPPALRLRLPETRHDARKHEVPGLVAKLGGRAAVKVPYSNAGQGIHLITTAADLEAFMALPEEYERYVVQGFIGDARMPGMGSGGEVSQTGVVVDGQRYAADVRIVIASTPAGLRPMTLYARRSRFPFDAGRATWERYLTNLSMRRDSGSVDPDTRRVILAGVAGFAALGWDERLLVDAFLQSCMALVAVDRYAATLAPGGRLARDALRVASDDDTLLAEIPAGEFAR